MKIGNINADEAINNVKELLSKDKRISASLKVAIELILILVRFLINRLKLNSSNSSKPPSTDPNRERKKKAKSNKNSGGQNGHKGHRLEKIKNPDKIESICNIQTWKEIVGVKNSKLYVENPIIFTESLFKNGVKTLVSEIIDYFSKGPIEPDLNPVVVFELILDKIEQVELDTNCIWVAVTIGKDDPQYFSLKRFNDESKPFKFAKMLRK